MATRIKIKVIDKNNNLNIRLPGIPFWLISSLCNFAFLLKSIILKHADDLDEETRAILNELDYKSIKEIFDVLRSYEQFDLVDISSGDGTEVKISIL
ncbi:MAG: hypothetical protein GX077_07400 [Tissierellia bacterium]|nr:hypothetical protein [Tissierellia bacterium]